METPAFKPHELRWLGVLSGALAEGQALSLSAWGLKLFKTPLGARGPNFKDFIERLGFESHSKVRGSQIITLWTYGATAQAAVREALGFQGSSLPAPLASSKLKAASRDLTPAAQRGVLTFASNWRLHKFSQSITLAAFQKAVADHKNLVASAEVLGLVDREKIAGQAPSLRLTPLGVDAVGDDQTRSQAACKRVLAGYAPYAMLAARALKGESQETALASLVSTYHWKPATARQVLNGFKTLAVATGLPEPFHRAHGNALRRDKNEAGALTEPAPDARRSGALAKARSLFGPLASSGGEFFNLCCARLHGELFGSSSRGALSKAAILKLFEAEFERSKADFLGTHSNQDAKASARKVFDDMAANGWIAPSSDYNVMASTYRPAPLGKRLMRALAEGDLPTSMSAGSFRNCKRALEDFCRADPDAARHLVDGMRSAADVNEDLAAEADQWRVAARQMVEHYDDYPAFTELASKLADRLARAQRQMGSDGVDANWGAVHALLEKARRAFLGNHLALASIAEELAYAKGGAQPWGERPEMALDWALAEIAAFMDAARDSRGPELAQEMAVFAKISRQLVSSRAAMGSTEALAERLRASLNHHDRHEAEARAQDLMQAWLAAPVQALRLENLRFKDEREPLPKVITAPPAPPDPWLLFDAQAEVAAAQAAMSLPALAELLVAEAQARGGAFKLSELGRDGWTWPLVQAALCAWPLAHAQDALFECVEIPGNPLIDFAAGVREDAVVRIRPQASDLGSAFLENEPFWSLT